VTSATTAAVVRRFNRLDLTVAPWAWPFAAERRAEIDAHFAAVRANRPHIWNGRVLMLRNPRDDGDCFCASYFETDYASLLAWLQWGRPDTEAFNGFGMGALRGSDGVFVLGEMAYHTATAGQIYFPAGTPDPNDLRGDILDMAASVEREVEEEVGLAPGDTHAADHWHCIRTGQLIAFMRLLQADVPAEVLRQRIERNVAAQRMPEFSAIHLVRDRRDFLPAMPSFVTAYIDAMTGDFDPA
jgi:8-oxo-dGTP pyrophosphatase MutT (NUDIX family)